MSDRTLPPALSRLLDKASAHRNKGDQLLFTGSLQDPIPRHLIVDPDLSAVAVRIWAYLRTHIHANDTSSPCPTYKDIMHQLGLGSKSTVSQHLNLLRATRWLSVKEKTTDHRGYFSGSIYILHTQPVTIADAIVLDEEFMEILVKLSNHANPNYHRLAMNLISEAEAFFDANEASSLPTIDARIEASEASQPDSKDSGLSFFYQRKAHKPTNTEKGGHTVATFQESSSKAKNVGYSQQNGQNSAKTSKNKGGHTVATFQNHPGPIIGPGSGSNNRTAISSSSSLNKTTTNNKKLFKKKKISQAEEIEDNNYEFHDLYLKFDQNQKHLALLSLNRIPAEYRQMILDEVAARVKMSEEGLNPSQKPIGSPLAYVKWQCNEVLNDRIALTGRHPDSVSGGHTDREEKRKQLEKERQAREDAHAKAHEARIAALLKKQNESSQ